MRFHDAAMEYRRGLKIRREGWLNIARYIDSNSILSDILIRFTIDDFLHEDWIAIIDEQFENDY